MVWGGSQGVMPMVEAGEYAGEDRVSISATQLSIPAARARRVVDGWIDLFAAGPTGIRELEFTSRTPARLFDALRMQQQLTSLIVKWGDHADLTALSGMRRLEHLDLGSAPSITDLTPIGSLHSLRSLRVLGCFRLHDYSPLGRLHRLEELDVRGNERPAMHADSLSFLASLTMLRLLTFSARIDDLDYSPVMSLTQAEHISVWPTPNMTPPEVDLEWWISNLPGVQAKRATPQPRPLDRPMRLDPMDMSLFSEIDEAWVALLEGRRTRLDTIVWARRALSGASPIAAQGLMALEKLTGHQWTTPPDRMSLEMQTWLEQWRKAVHDVRRDPDSEDRQFALLSVRRLGKSKSAKQVFDHFVKDGLLGPDDAASLGFAV